MNTKNIKIRRPVFQKSLILSIGLLILLLVTLVLSENCHGNPQAKSNRIKGPIGTPIGKPIALEGNPNLEGIAFDDKEQKLYVLSDTNNDVDGDGLAETGETIQIYTYDPTSATLRFLSSFTVPPTNGNQFLTNGRGLAFINQHEKQILYTLNSQPDGSIDSTGKKPFVSQLWQIDITNPDHIQVRVVDLDQAVFDLRGAEVFDLACDKKNRIYISFDASRRAKSLSEQRSRGILRFQVDGNPISPKILPANGKSLKHHNLGLTIMEMDDYEYLIGSIEERTNNKNQEIYTAEAETGRGLFKFDAPPIADDLNTERRLAYGAGVLWVGEQNKGLDRVQQVVINNNLYEPLVGYKRPRKIEVTLTSKVLCPEGENSGTIFHNIGHPLSNKIEPSQGSDFENYTLRMKGLDANKKPTETGTELLISYAPLDDSSSLSKISSARYPATTKNHAFFKTVLQEDFWTREYRHFVYPHLASNDLGILKNTDFQPGHLKRGYPANDSLPRFHWTHQERIFEDFIRRAKAYIVQKYGVEADLTNPYWAARNISEYIRDNYNYPAPTADQDGTIDSRGNVVDYKNFHVANGPAIYKMIMTDPRFKVEMKKRRSGCMAAGGVFLAVMRYLGFPARWIGTSIQKTPEQHNPDDTNTFHDLNHDGMFNKNDYMDVIHGHYTNEIYLGPGYGWQRFDATPKKPDDRDGDGLDYEDFAHLHSIDSQYEQMKRKVTSGHDPKAVASSLGIGYNEHLFNHHNDNWTNCAKKSIYHKATGVYTSACQGGQCYDFIFIHERPSKVRGRNAIRWLPSLTFDVTVNGRNPKVGENRVEFTPQGPWTRFEPDARVEIVLRIDDGRTITHQVLKTDIAWNQGNATVVIPESVRGKSIHIQVRKIGPEKFIGGASPKFNLP